VIPQLRPFTSSCVRVFICVLHKGRKNATHLFLRGVDAPNFNEILHRFEVAAARCPVQTVGPSLVPFAQLIVRQLLHQVHGVGLCILHCQWVLRHVGGTE
jgi:hypothetical protein